MKQRTYTWLKATLGSDERTNRLARKLSKWAALLLLADLVLLAALVLT